MMTCRIVLTVVALAATSLGQPLDANSPEMDESTQILSRLVFYNQCFYDGNRAAIDTGPIDGNYNDDGDAVDPTLRPLMPGLGLCSTFDNYTTYAKGLNGLVYDVKMATRPPELWDFAFRYYGRTGTMPPVQKVATDLKVWPGAGVGGSDRVFIAFANNAIQDGWLEVTISSEFGLPEPEAHWWGNVIGEAKNDPWILVVNALDLSKVKSKYWPIPPCPVWWNWDFNKDGVCNALDISISKSRYVPPPRAVQPICK